MSNKKYDIFISYRRNDCGDKAEHLKDLLDRDFNNRVSFDRENLTGVFDVALARRIDRCKDFVVIIGKESLRFSDEDMKQDQVDLYNYLGLCSEEDFEKKINELGPNATLDFMRIELTRALHRKDLNVIPVVPERTDSFDFSRLSLPADIGGIKRYEAVFYSDHPDRLFKDIMPKLTQKLVSKPTKINRKLVMALAALVIVGLVVFAGYGIKIKQDEIKKNELLGQARSNAEKITEAFDDQLLLSDEISYRQAKAIASILENMIFVDGGTFMQGPALLDDGSYDESMVYTRLETPQIESTVEDFFIGKYEVSVSEWCDVLGLKYDDADGSLPVANVSFDDCQQFVDVLKSLTSLNFRMPSEAEWEYAARGGARTHGYIFSGSNNPTRVAWGAANSGNRRHVRNDEDGGLLWNELDLYDMSGNVCEWCDELFRPYNPEVPVINPEARVVRGGSYNSDPRSMTVYHRDLLAPEQKTNDIGLRLVISEN